MRSRLRQEGSRDHVAVAGGVLVVMILVGLVWLGLLALVVGWLVQRKS